MQNRVNSVLTLLLLVCARLFAEGRQKEIKVEPESLKVTITSGTTAEAKLSLTNTAKDSLVLELEAGELILTASDQIAVMRFPENGGGKERLHLTLAAEAPRHRREIKLKVSKVKAVGAYEGALAVRNLTRGTEEVIKVQVRKMMPLFLISSSPASRSRTGESSLNPLRMTRFLPFCSKIPRPASIGI